MVEEIHLEGGTILGTSRGLPNVPEIVKRLGAALPASGAACAAVCVPLPAPHQSCRARPVHVSCAELERCKSSVEGWLPPPPSPPLQTSGRSTCCSSWAGAAATPPPRPSTASAAPRACRAAWWRCPSRSTTTCCSSTRPSASRRRWRRRRRRSWRPKWRPAARVSWRQYCCSLFRCEWRARAPPRMALPRLLAARDLRCCAFPTLMFC
jgi:hypothetical protein